MELDFSGLFDAPETVDKESKEKAWQDAKATLQSPAAAAEGKQQAASLLIAHREKREAQKRTLEVYADYQGNIRRAAEGRTALLKGIREGQSLCTLLLQAVGIIGAMTGDEDYPQRVRAELLAVYGAGFAEPEPHRMELQAVTDRLERLTEAARRETDPGELQRINGAIKAHRAVLDRLNATTRQQDRKTKKEQRKI